jgi:LEA14-like dessication related protein
MTALLLMLGCTGGMDYSAFIPKVKFNRLDVKDIDFQHIDTDFVFEVENPDPVGIPLQRFNYDLAFEGISVLTGDAKDQLELNPAASSEVALPVSLVFESLYELVQATRGEDTIGFALTGNFGFDSDIGPVDVNYDAEDDFPALRIPKVQLGTLKLQNADLSTANFQLSFDVDNDHASAIDLHDMDFNLNIAGLKTGGTMEKVGDVPGATTDTFNIPFGVDYADAINAIGAIASGQKLNAKMDADVQVDTPFGTLPLTIDQTGDIKVTQ